MIAGLLIMLATIGTVLGILLLSPRTREIENMTEGRKTEAGFGAFLIMVAAILAYIAGGLS
jgi:hypothetical protein